MAIDTLSLERICSAGWPGVADRWLGGWLLRFGNGFSNRANSVLVLGEPEVPVQRALDEVTEWYAGRRQVPVFQLAGAADVPAPVAGCDAELERRGWRHGDAAVVLTAELPAVLDRCGNAARYQVAVTPEPGADWLALYRYRDRPLPPGAVPVLTAGPGPGFVTLSDGDRVLGVSRGVVTDGWLGVTAVTVIEAARRRGVGTAVLAETLRWGAVLGARQVYLQVERTNAAALAMYARLGFTEHHRYRYRRPPAGSTVGG